MINKVTLRRFKRFRMVEFELPGHVVVAGPNNMGKTTLLQAIAAWGLALNRWKQVADPHKQIAVKVIDDRGNELLVIEKLQ